MIKDKSRTGLRGLVLCEVLGNDAHSTTCPWNNCSQQERDGVCSSWPGIAAGEKERRKIHVVNDVSSKVLFLCI